MKKSLLLLCAIIVFSGTRAQSVYDQIRRVNSNWNNIGAFTSELNKDKQISSERELIQTHLQYVIKYLKTQQPKLTPVQSAHRKQCIETLNSYRANGVFPINTYHRQRQPYFIDNYGTYCAVGYLLKQSGYANVAQRIHNEMNYAYVREIPESYLKGWADEYGFTIDELALIQPNYAPQLICQDDTLYIGYNTSTVCHPLMNDIIQSWMCQNPPVTLSVIQAPQHGTFTPVNQAGDTAGWVYTPTSGYTGTDKVIYKVFAGWENDVFCGYSIDTSEIMMNVVPQAGQFSTYHTADANYDGVHDLFDYLYIARNIGQTGGTALLNANGCNLNYSPAWSKETDYANASASDVDKNGKVDNEDLRAAVTDCFAAYTNYTYGQDYRLKLLDYDSTIRTGQISIPVVVVDKNDSVVPVKALVMQLTQNQASYIDLLAGNIACLPQTILSSDYPESYYKRVQSYSSFVVSTGGAVITKNGGTANCKLTSSFAIAGSTSSYTVGSKGEVTLSIGNVYILDAADSIWPVEGAYARFKADLVSGMNEISKGEAKIYPNPLSDNTLTIQLINAPAPFTNFQLLDITGRVIMQKELTETKTSLELGGISKGLYLYNINSKGQKLHSDKLIIQ